MPSRSRTSRICASFLLLGTLAATPVSADQCGAPNFPPPETALTRDQPDYSFSDMSTIFPGTCAPEIQVYQSYNGDDGDYGISFDGPLTITKFYPCTGDKVTIRSVCP
jgi:hypothetical protein